MKALLLTISCCIFSNCLWAQEGPVIPCVNCDQLVHAPYPETGSWYNPQQSGSGLNLEIQNGVLVGYYYGYDADGKPDWQLFHGKLMRSEKEGVQWDFETHLLHFKDGNCLGCDYKAPDEPVVGADLRIEFMQRNYMKLTIGENTSQFFVPIIYGSKGKFYFEESSPYHFPEYSDNFILLLRSNLSPPEPWNWLSMDVFITRAVFGSPASPIAGKLHYYVDVILSRVEAYPWAKILCELDEIERAPGCKFIVGDKEYIIPAANMSDSRFFGEAADGSTVEGIRMSYD